MNPISKNLKSSLALGIGHIAMFFVNKGILLLGVPFYQMTLGLDPFMLSLSSIIPVLLATFISPWVGHLSDCFKMKYGSRKLFIIWSSIFSGLLYGMLWMVPLDWPQWQQFSYLFIFSLLFSLVSTFLTIPLTCLTYEVSEIPQERTKTFAISTLFNKFCALSYHWLFPLSQLAFFGSAIFGLQLIGWFVGIFLITLMGLIPVLFADESYVVKQQDKPELVMSLKFALANKKFLLILVIIFLQIGGGVYAASMDIYLLVYYVCSGDIAEGTMLKGVLSTAHALVGIALVGAVLKLANFLGPLKSLTYIFLMTAVGGLLKWFIFVPNAGYLVALDAVLCNIVWISMAVIIPTLVAGICDNDRKETGQDHKGIYIAVKNWAIYISSGIAMIASGLTLNLIGFDAHLGAEQTDTAITAMRVILAIGTTIFSLLAIIFVLLIKIQGDKQGTQLRLSSSADI